MSSREQAEARESTVQYLDREVRVRRAVHAQHVQRERVALVEGAHRVQRGGDGHVQRQRQLAQRLVAVEHALPGVDDGAAGRVQQLRHALEHRVGRREGRELVARRRQQRPVADGRHDVLREVQVYGPGLAPQRHLERLVHHRLDLLHALDLVGPLGAGPGQLHGLALLEGVRPHRGHGHLPTSRRRRRKRRRRSEWKRASRRESSRRTRESTSRERAAAPARRTPPSAPSRPSRPVAA